MNDRPTVDTESDGAVGYFVPFRNRPEIPHATFRDVIGILKRYRLTIATVSLLFLAMATSIALLMQPIYRSEVVAVPVQAPHSNTGLLSLAGQLPGLTGLAGLGTEDNEVQEALATLRSRKFTVEFIVDKNLLPILFARSWDNVARKWTVSPADEPTLWDGYKMFQSDVRSVSQDSATGIVTIAIEWHDPVVAAEWANELVARLNSRMRSRAVTEAERSLEYLHAQMEETALVELRVGLSRLIEAQLSKVMLANSRDDYLFRVIDAAVPSEMDDFVRPDRLFMVAIGGVGGFLFGVLISLGHNAYRRRDLHEA